MSDKIKDLSAEASAKALFYYTFLAALHGGETPSIPYKMEEIGEEMSGQWQQAARKYILMHPKTKCMSHLLPQNEDLILVYRRGIVFVTNMYWLPASQTKFHASFPVGLEVGTDEDEDPLLEMRSDIERRRNAVKFRNAKCNCGKNSTGPCCLPRSRCGCVKSSRPRLSRCGCSPLRCANRPGGEEAAKVRIEKAHITAVATAQRTSSLAPTSLAHFLNSSQSVTNEAPFRKEVEDPEESDDDSESEDPCNNILEQQESGDEDSDSEEEIEAGGHVRSDDFIFVSINRQEEGEEHWAH